MQNQLAQNRWHSATRALSSRLHGQVTIFVYTTIHTFGGRGSP